MKRVVNLLLLILWIIIIFILSNQTGSVSKSNSNIIVNALYDVVNLSKHDLIVLVRKSAHIFEYFILFLLVYNCFKGYNVKNIVLSSTLFCILCSIIDELHQLFILDRTGKIIDVFIDSIGIVIGLIIVEVAYGKKKKVKENSSTKN